MSVSQDQIEELRKLFLKDYEAKGEDSVHPKDLEKVKTNDKWLKRFILHHEGNVQNALNMMWTSLTWRKENNVNEIKESNVRMDLLCTGGFFTHGTDTDGCRLLVFKCNKHTKGNSEMNEIKRCVIYWFERAEREVNGDQITIFFDMEGCGLSNMDMEFIRYLIGLFKEYYPYFLNYIIIFEMAWILNAAFKIVKTWLPEKAVEKIKFVNKKDIKNYVPLDQALKSWGGENPYVFSFVPETFPDTEKAATAANITSNNRKVHFVDGSMSEISASSGDNKESDGGLLRVKPSGLITFVRDGNELVSTLELQNTDAICHLSYKLKTTSPEKFRVKPSTGCLAPGDFAKVAVTLLPGFQLGGLSRDKFLVMSTQLESNELNLDLSELWKNTSGRKIHQHRLKCVQSGESPKNGGSSTMHLQTHHSSENDENHLNKLSASVSQLSNCQKELHNAIRLTQYYQMATVLLVLALGIVLAYIVQSNVKDIVAHQSSYCKDIDRP